MFSKIVLLAFVSVLCYSTSVHAQIPEECVDYFGPTECHILKNDEMCKAFSNCYFKLFNVKVDACDRDAVQQLNIPKEKLECDKTGRCIIQELGLEDADGNCNITRHEEVLDASMTFDSATMENKVMETINDCYENNMDCLEVGKCCHKGVMGHCYPEIQQDEAKECLKNAKNLKSNV